MSYVIKVRLNPRTKPPSLSVDPCELEVQPRAKKQWIRWELDADSLPNGSFLPLHISPPGFQRVRRRGRNPLGDPSIGVQGRSIEVTDTHIGAETAGRLSYRLHVISEGKHYQSFCPRPAGAGANGPEARGPNDPVIINKVQKVPKPKPPKPKQ